MIVNFLIALSSILIFINALELNPTAKAELINSKNLSLVDIKVTKASILQCNMHCVANSLCDAFTLQKRPNISARDESNVCKLQRSKTSFDSEDFLSIPQDGDIIMILKRGSIYESLVTVPQTQSRTSTSSSMDTKSSPMDTTTSTDTTTSMDTKSSPTDTTSSTSASFPTRTSTTNSPTPMIATTTELEGPIPMPKNGYQTCTAMDELGDDKYIFFWSVIGNPGATATFTVVYKNNINGTKLQDMEVTKVFPGLPGSLVTAAFTANNITYLRNDYQWYKYKINKNFDGLILNAERLVGGISNGNLQNATYFATTIGNDSVLWRQTDGKVFCFNIAVIDSYQIAQPPPSQQCEDAVNFVMQYMNATSALGHDLQTLRFLFANKLYPFKE